MNIKTTKFRQWQTSFCFLSLLYQHDIWNSTIHECLFFEGLLEGSCLPIRRWIKTKNILSLVWSVAVTDLGKEVGWVNDWMVLHRVLAQHQTSLLQFILSKWYTYVVIHHSALRKKVDLFEIKCHSHWDAYFQTILCWHAFCGFPWKLMHHFLDTQHTFAKGEFQTDEA